MKILTQLTAIVVLTICTIACKKKKDPEPEKIYVTVPVPYPVRIPSNNNNNNPFVNPPQPGTASYTDSNGTTQAKSFAVKANSTIVLSISEFLPDSLTPIVTITLDQVSSTGIFTNVTSTKNQAFFTVPPSENYSTSQGSLSVAVNYLSATKIIGGFTIIAHNENGGKKILTGSFDAPLTDLSSFPSALSGTQFNPLDPMWLLLLSNGLRPQ